MLSLWFLKVHTLARPSSCVDDIVYTFHTRQRYLGCSSLSCARENLFVFCCFGHSLLTLEFFQYL